MNVLVVASANRGNVRPFVADQVEALRNAGCNVDIYALHGHGPFGYLRNFPHLKRKLKKNKYDLIHAHYGLCGFLSVLQSLVPVVITYHGLDLPDESNAYSLKHGRISHFLSGIAFRNAVWNIVTHPGMQPAGSGKCSVIPCGINPDVFNPMDREEARKELNFDLQKKYILFSGSFKDPVKNYSLAAECMRRLSDAELINLAGYTRNEVVKLLSACNALLVTSHYETGPLIVKEALACNCPVVSVDVGDVKNVLSNAESCYVVEPNATALKDALEKVLADGKRYDTRKQALQFSNQIIAPQILKVYENTSKK
ncbi:MAG: glycosyltransferase family 4 protein [Bacteroidota bacterium]